MKKFISGFLIVLLILQGFVAIPVSASDEKPMEYHALGKNKVEFALDEIVVQFEKDSKPFRVIKIPEGKVKEKVEEYSHRPDVVYAEPNYYAQALFAPNDPLYSYQWNFGTSDIGGIGMENAWNITTGNPGVIVAIVDTGIAYENYSIYMKAPDLASASFVQGYDFVNNDSHPNDDNSHGTHVAGTVAQNTGNGIGVAGVAYNTSLMPVKVLNKSGSGTYANIAYGIRYAADNGARVINMSLGGSSSSTTLENALAYAYGKGVTIVAAAGNNGTSTISYPAAYDQYVIAVGATRYDKMLAYYSNYGQSLDLVAPGGDMTVDQNSDGYGDGILQNTFNPSNKNPKAFGYYFLQGTSMATPHVAGVAALLIAKGNAQTPAEIRTALQETSLDLGNSGWDSRFGWGLVDAHAALNWRAEPDSAPVADDQSVSTDEDVAKAITLTGTDADGDLLAYSIVNGPTHGALSGSAPDVIYAPSENYNGPDSFTFRAYDGKLYSKSATVTITVAPVNDVPVAVAQSVTTLKGEPCTITLEGTDADGDLLTYSIVNGPTNGVLSGTGPNVSYAPNSGYTGPDSFTFVVNDGTAFSGSATVSITVSEVLTAPTIKVTNMETGSKVAGKNTFVWAIATTKVDVDGAAVQGATVEGHWEAATSDTDSGITGSSGEVSLQSDSVKNSRNPITFTFIVDRVTIGTVTYEPNGISGSVTYQ